MEPEGTARLTAMSADVCIVTPWDEPSVAAPIVRPPTVITTDLSTTGGPLGSPAIVNTSELFEVGWKAKLRSCTLLDALVGVTSGSKNAVG